MTGAPISGRALSAARRWTLAGGDSHGPSAGGPPALRRLETPRDAAAAPAGSAEAVEEAAACRAWCDAGFRDARWEGGQDGKVFGVGYRGRVNGASWATWFIEENSRLKKTRTDSGSAPLKEDACISRRCRHLWRLRSLAVAGPRPLITRYTGRNSPTLAG